MVRQAHHERNQKVTVRPEPVEGLVQRFPNMMRWLTALFLYILIAVQTAWGGDIALHLGSHSIRATIANTPYSRERGLMQYTGLCENCGMLFIFPQAGKYSFWMKDTPLPLSIAFIAADGSILNIAEMQANTMQSHSAQGNALYALEMNKAWFAEHGINAQEHVQGLQQAPRGY